MGPEHSTNRGRRSRRGGKRPRALPARECVRKGCGRRYRPSRSNQRYCQDVDCLREVKRWRAVERQQRWRERPEVREKRRLSEKARRARRCASGQRRVRGDAGEARGEGPVCGRPGCFEPPARSERTKARYCGPDCRHVMRRVRDRERKWRLRLMKRMRAQKRRRAARERGAALAASVSGKRRGLRASTAGPAPAHVAASSPIDPSPVAGYASAPQGRASDDGAGAQTIRADRSETGEDAPDGGDAVRMDGRARPP